MKHYLFSACSFVLLVVLVCLPNGVRSESRYAEVGGATAINLQARLNLEVVIPKLIYLRVGTGTNLANNTSINLIDFNVPAAVVGRGTQVAATVGSGDLGNGEVTARVLGNNGTITLSATTSGSLRSPAGRLIPYSQVSTTATALTTALVMPAPVLSSGATTTVSIPAATGRLVQRDARWRYRYENSAIVAAGTYGGVNTNNSRVTYTASML